MGFKSRKIRQHEEAYMAIPLHSKQFVSFEELLMSQGVWQEALTRLLVQKGNIYERGVSGEGEGSGQSNEEKKMEGLANDGLCGFL